MRLKKLIAWQHYSKDFRYKIKLHTSNDGQLIECFICLYFGKYNRVLKVIDARDTQCWKFY